MSRLFENRVAHIIAAIGLAALVAAGCGPQPLARDEKVEMLMARNVRLQEQLLVAAQQLAEANASEEPLPNPPKSPVAEDPFRAVAIRFGKTTGGLDPDGRPGSARLKVILEPLDTEGDVVKRAGGLELAVYDADGETPRCIAHWAWAHHALAKTWLSGMGLYGYVLKLDWPEGTPPAAERLLLRAAFTTLSGEALSAEKSFALRRYDSPQTPGVPSE